MGMLVCGMLTFAHVRRLTTGTCGFDTRCCTWLTSRIVRPLVLEPRSAAYNRLPSSLTFMPWNMKSVLIHTGVGTDGLVTSSAVTYASAVAVVYSVLPSGANVASWPAPPIGPL